MGYKFLDQKNTVSISSFCFTWSSVDSTKMLVSAMMSSATVGVNFLPSSVFNINFAASRVITWLSHEKDGLESLQLDVPVLTSVSSCSAIASCSAISLLAWVSMSLSFFNSLLCFSYIC